MRNESFEITAEQKNVKRSVGRPSKYSQKIADSICELLVSGMSQREICKLDRMPGASTVFRWLSEYKEFREQYARAREAQADTLADEIISIADEDPEYITDANGIRRIDPASVNRQRLRLDARKWTASKLKPKRYGNTAENDANLASTGQPGAGEWTVKIAHMTKDDYERSQENVIEHEP